MKIKRNKELTLGGLTFDCFRPRKICLNKMKSPVDRIKIGVGIALLSAMTGCVGFVGGGYGGEVVVPGPDLLLFGGGYERGGDVHAYSNRGFESRSGRR
jgi:hypothetical protein